MIDWSEHSPYSDPGPDHAAAVAEVPTDPRGVAAVARNLIGHYRADAPGLPESTRDDVDLRWLHRQLTVDRERHGTPLAAHRPLVERLQGCCRDHALFCVGVLRSAGIPARTRVGFAGYFEPPYHHDHVVVELWRDGRWVRFDPELDDRSPGLDDPYDLPAGAGAPFRTAAEVYRDHRDGTIDPEQYGVGPGVGIGGAWFIEGEVLHELAHRYGDELLLWDSWGVIPAPDEAGEPDRLALLDRVSALLVAADAGDAAAEDELFALYRSDDRLHPGETVLRRSPIGREPVPDRL